MNTLITPNFRHREFACKDGTPVPPHLHYNMRMLAGSLEVLKGHFQRPIIINSGYRTPSYNKRVGGAVNSYHMSCQAVDINIPGVPPKQVHQVILSFMKKRLIPPGAVILYPTFVHYDHRGFILDIKK